MDQPPKRQVRYNEEAILCPTCKKRVRLNNNGLVRKHMSGRLGSPECKGSNADPHPKTTNHVVAEPEPEPVEPLFFPEPMFSDLA